MKNQKKLIGKIKSKRNKIQPIKIKYNFEAEKGLNNEVVNLISEIKQEPEWMRDFRLEAFRIYQQKKMPDWGVDLSQINFQEISYYLSALSKNTKSWEKIPHEIREVYEKLGIPEAEQKYLAGSSAQLESEVIYDSLKKELQEKGVIFTDTLSGLKNYPELFKKYFATVVPPNDNALAALNSALWSGGSFVYIPKNVKLELPLQAFFLINKERVGQSERTLIIADEGSEAHYIEGCTAPQYNSISLHTGVVEIVVKKNAKFRYTTIQNWSHNIYNLTTQRAIVYENGLMQWVDTNLGAKATMKYPTCILKEKGSRGEILSLGVADLNQQQDTGGKMIHLASDTHSKIISKSISKNGGRNSYRGKIVIDKMAKNSSSYVSCDALILDKKSRSDTYPIMKIKNEKSKVEHEAKLEKIDEEKLFYLQNRGLTKDEAQALLINGFIEPIIKEIPLEYAVEINALMQISMKGKVG